MRRVSPSALYEICDLVSVGAAKRKQICLYIYNHVSIYGMRMYLDMTCLDIQDCAECHSPDLMNNVLILIINKY